MTSSVLSLAYPGCTLVKFFPKRVAIEESPGDLSLISRVPGTWPSRASEAWRLQSGHSLPNVIPTSVKIILPTCTRNTGNVWTVLRTNFEPRCNPLLSMLPSRRPCRCSSRLPPASCCPSRRSRSAQYFFSALGWRCPHSSRSSGSCCSVARPAGLLARISEKSTEVAGSLLGDKLQAEVSVFRFSTRTVEDPPAPGSVTARIRLQFPVRSSVHNLVILTSHQEPQCARAEEQDGIVPANLLPLTAELVEDGWLRGNTPPLPRHEMPRRLLPALVRTQVDLSACAPPAVAEPPAAQAALAVLLAAHLRRLPRRTSRSTSG